MTRPVEYMRADAARNLKQIVAVAARLLAEQPAAGMAEVATAAGVSRATVYRHFETREALIEAIRAAAFEAAQQALVDCRLDEGTATEALQRLIVAWLDVTEYYALAQQGIPKQRDENRRRVLGEPVLALIARGQTSGEFASDLEPEWVLRSFGALLLAGARAVTDGILTHENAPDSVFQSLYGGLRA